MDAKLRRDLDAIARDNRSGAAELTGRAVRSIDAWLSRSKAPGADRLLQVAGALLKAQPSMAPMLRLANEMALAADAREPSKHLRRSLNKCRRHFDSAPLKMAAHFRRWIGNQREVVIMTYSYSSTVATCLHSVRPALDSVFCSEGRPAGEGFAMAQKLAQWGIPVTFCTDATLTGQVWPNQILLIGADAILRGGIASKVGTKALILLSQVRRCPVVIAADTLKFWPEPTRQSVRWNWKFGPDAEIWEHPPKKVTVYNLYFEVTFFSKLSRIRFLTEHGWLTPRQVLRELSKIRVSPKLKDLID